MDNEDCFVVEGRLSLPYQYYAGKTGSRFLCALRDERKILGIRCATCHKVYIPPRSHCDVCFSDIRDNWVDLPGTGVVTGFTIIRYKEPYQPLDPPYIQALIRLDGADTPLVHIIKGVPLEKIKVGLKVRAVFAANPPATILAIDHFASDPEIG